MSRLINFLRTGIAIVALFVSHCSCATAQSDGPSAPVALIVTYKAKPGERLHFLRVMRSEGKSQFENWKRQGVFSDYALLAPAFAGAGINSPDLYVVLRFSRFTDLAGWQQIERTEPGGLPDEAQGIAWADTSGTAQLVAEERAGPPTQASQFFILTYDVVVSIPAYRKYVLGYVRPQFDEWIKADTLNSYSVFTNQNPAGAPWGSFILLEYKNIEALGRREIVKDLARQKLAATNSEWKRLSEDKTNIRTERTAIPALPLR